VNTSPVLTWGFTAPGYFLCVRFVPQTTASFLKPLLLQANKILAAAP
jgi:hypothetical protein